MLLEKTQPGIRALSLPEVGIPSTSLDQLLPDVTLRKISARLPEVSQLDLVRHFVALSQQNFAIDVGFYPLGSCTMKYNPKICDRLASLPGFASLHPDTPAAFAQGTLSIMYELQQLLADLTGFDAVSLQPAAGAQGELTGMRMIKAYLDRQEETQRRVVLIPDSAHGTNPASARMCGFDVVEIKSRTDGRVDLAALTHHLGSTTAALMLTNPSTLGLFEQDILAITELVHQAGGLMYYDGANLNAIVGRLRPGDMGFDVMHINTHKTFATPHGGGGPGCGPVACTAALAPYLPTPLVLQEKTSSYYRLELPKERPDSIGRVKWFYGNVDMMIRALAYLRSYGSEGLAAVSGDAVLNANYVRSQLADSWHIPYEGLCMHEFVITPQRQKMHHPRLTTMAIVKRLMDFGIHPPTVYFPLVVHEAIMIEPTETESRQTLDTFVSAMRQIAHECETDAELILNAPHSTLIQRPDESQANRKPDLNFFSKLDTSTC